MPYMVCPPERPQNRIITWCLFWYGMAPSYYRWHFLSLNQTYLFLNPTNVQPYWFKDHIIWTSYWFGDHITWRIFSLMDNNLNCNHCNFLKCGQIFIIFGCFIGNGILSKKYNQNQSCYKYFSQVANILKALKNILV